MSCAAAPVAPAQDLRERRAGLLRRLVDLAYGACVAAGDRVIALKADPDAPVPAPSWAPHWRRKPPPGHAEHLGLVLARMYLAVVKLGAILKRVQVGGPPPAPPAPRPRRAPDLALPVIVRLTPMLRPRPLPCLGRLLVPGAQALRNRLIRLLSEPGMRELLDAEPEIRRAAAPVARALGLGRMLRRKPGRPGAVRRESRAEAAAPPYESRPVRRRPEPPPAPASDAAPDARPGLAPLPSPVPIRRPAFA